MQNYCEQTNLAPVWWWFDSLQTHSPSKSTMHNNNPVFVLAETSFPLTLPPSSNDAVSLRVSFLNAWQLARELVIEFLCVYVCVCLKHDVIIQSSPVISSAEQHAICERWSKTSVFVLDACNVSCCVCEVIALLCICPPWIVKHLELHQANRRESRKKNKADLQVTFCF